MKHKVKYYLPQPWVKRMSEKKFWSNTLIWLGAIHVMPLALYITSVYMDCVFNNPLSYFFIGYVINFSFYMMYLIGHLMAEGRLPWQKIK